MGDHIDLIEKLEDKTNMKLSKLFWAILIIVSVLNIIVLTIMTAATMSEFKYINSLLFKIVAGLWIFPLIVLIYDFLQYLKHKWDTRIVIDETLGLPQNAIFSKKESHEYRRITKDELKGWKLKKYKIKDVSFISEKNNINRKLCDPDLPYEEFKRITKNNGLKV